MQGVSECNAGIMKASRQVHRVKLLEVLQRLRASQDRLQVPT